MLPLISCLCPTKNDPEFVKIAINCFNNQTYPNKELILVTDELNPYLKELEKFTLKKFGCKIVPSDNIKLFCAPHGTKIGGLRSISVEKASGEYVATWDDDDVHHRDRITTQYKAIESSGKEACYLKKALINDTISGDKGISKDWSGVEASMLALKNTLPKYDETKSIAEDTPIKYHHFKNKKVIVIDEPHLYVYTIHEGNTCEYVYVKNLIDTVI